ncbi:MAG: 2-amino-4-hydroxy-6-hydroxymethyldihydropteridine diphosphokinase [Planctomycetota bacterium]
MVKRSWHDAYIGLGSNMGRRKKNVAAALNALEITKEIEVIKVSKLYETEPVGGPEDQGPYINAAAHIRTNLSPLRLLAVCLNIEESLGRKRSIRWGARTIDLDVLCYEQKVVATPKLTLPHPLMHERRFVMEPLAEIAPDLVHPMLEQTAREIFDSLCEPEC